MRQTVTCRLFEFNSNSFKNWIFMLKIFTYEISVYSPVLINNNKDLKNPVG